MCSSTKMWALQPCCTVGGHMALGCCSAVGTRCSGELLRNAAEIGNERESVSDVLLTLGGADRENVTARFLAVLWPCVPPDCQIHVLIGPANPHETEMREIASKVKRMVLHVAASNVPQIMAGCDLAITAAGSTVYELGYLGVPMLLVVTADNQRPIATALDQLGVADRIDELGTSRTADLPSALESILRDPGRRALFAARFRDLVDGQGAARVVAVLSESSGVA